MDLESRYRLGRLGIASGFARLVRIASENELFCRTCDQDVGFVFIQPERSPGKIEISLDASANASSGVPCRVG
jgi:hypothetical protein